jgi:hypothetical protein
MPENTPPPVCPHCGAALKVGADGRVATGIVGGRKHLSATCEQGCVVAVIGELHDYVSSQPKTAV